MVETTNTPPWLWPRAAYLHIPFCAHRCGYCDFAVSVGEDHLIQLYVEALEVELTTLGSPVLVDTVFLGGGTPSYLPPAALSSVLESVRRWLPLREGGEFSIEATPESLSNETISILADFGVNRISLGAQTFRPELLAKLDRIHSADEIAPAIDRVRCRIENFSLDLIFGIPGQTLKDWEEDLSDALLLKPTHISTYGLTYEKGTDLWKRRARGEVRPVPEDDELAMYLHSIDRLSEEGYEHYEVSNFARQGRRCLHNETYWANEAYFGFGVGAARYVQRKRELNCRNTSDYIRRVLAGESPTFQSEELAPEESARETIAVQLRRSDGVNRVRFHEQTGFDFDSLVANRVAVYAREGLLSDDGAAIKLTLRGRCVADSLVAKIVWS
jgi:oxygen-independent coproporphyrinogen III oxidase